jgi:hypothetical protein
MWGVGVWSEVGVLFHPTGVVWDSGQDSGLTSPFLEPYCPQTIPSQTLLYGREHLHAQTVVITELIKMSLYPSAFRFPCSITRGPSPFHDKHPHTLMPPSPDFTVGTTHAGRYRSPGILHTQTLPTDRHMVERDSLPQITRFELSTVQWRRSLHHFRRRLAFTSEMFGLWAAARPWNPIPLNSRRTSWCWLDNS